MQSATVTVSKAPRSAVACPSTPSSTSHPSGKASCHCTSVPWTWWLSTRAGKLGWKAARKARQRLSTCPTGSSLQRPRLTGASPAGVSRGALSLAVSTLNLRPQRSQPLVDVLVAALDLADVVDHRLAL